MPGVDQSKVDYSTEKFLDEVEKKIKLLKMVLWAFSYRKTNR